MALDAGEFLMGSTERFAYPDDGEGPVRRVRARRRSGSSLARSSNAEFAAFVEATGHVTEAERFGWSFVFAGLLPDDFPPTRGGRRRAVVATGRGRRLAPPRGPAAPTLDGRGDHPVVHVSWNDAAGVLRLGRHAAADRGGVGVRGARRARGTAVPVGRRAGARRRAPDERLAGDVPASEHARATASSAPARSTPFAPNGYGLYNMTGNVWEWCADWFSPRLPHARPADQPAAARGAARTASTRGGSYLCHASYCRRYRVAARNALDTGLDDRQHRLPLRAGRLRTRRQDHPIRMMSCAARRRTLARMIRVSEAADLHAEHLQEWRDASKRVVRDYKAWCAAGRADRHRLHVAFLEALRREEQAGPAR